MVLVFRRYWHGRCVLVSEVEGGIGVEEASGLAALSLCEALVAVRIVLFFR